MLCLAAVTDQQLRATTFGKVFHCMKTVGDVMSRDIVTIHPASTVKTALLLLKGHEIGALPVVNGEALVGLLELHATVGRDPSDRVVDVMSADYASISPDVPVYQAAEEMAKAGSTRLIVEQDGTMVGIVTHSDLIPELGKSFDPLTGLPWTDTLRQWATGALQSGEEISILFFDLDEFGAFNKRYGHITGDAVLTTVAAVLKASEDQQVDQLCRMGGDEFALASVRPREDAYLLAQIVQDKISRIRVEGVEEPLGISYGVAGGRRGREREAVHFAATIDDLLNRASRECTAMKADRRRVASELSEGTHKAAGETGPSDAVDVDTGKPAADKPAGAPGDQRRVRALQIDYSSNTMETRVEVRLGWGDATYSSSGVGLSPGQTAVRIAAEACAQALEQIAGPEYRIGIDSIDEIRLARDTTALVSTVVVATAREASYYYGIAIVRRSDAYRAAVASVLSATNRFMSRAAEGAR